GVTDEREQPLRLKVVEGPDAGREFGLDRSAVIGRSARGADLVLHDPEVSRRHASLHLGEQGLKIEDLQSTNGTFVNDERVTGHRPVHPGDRLKIGTTVLEVEVAAELEPEQVTPVEGAAEEAAEPEEAPEPEEEPAAEEPEPARESEAPPAGVMEAISAAEIAKDLHARVVESFGPVLHAWSNRDSDEMRAYVSDAYLDRTLDALEELENDFQFNSIEELDLKDVAVRRPSGDEGEAVEAYLAFL